MHNRINFFYFPRFKEKLCGHQSQSAKEIFTATREATQDLPTNIFQQRFQQLYQSYVTRTVANSDYFGGGCEYLVI
jgi:myo-inositol catabolism protein IolC